MAFVPGALPRQGCHLSVVQDQGCKPADMALSHLGLQPIFTRLQGAGPRCEANTNATRYEALQVGLSETVPALWQCGPESPSKYTALFCNVICSLNDITRVHTCYYVSVHTTIVHVYAADPWYEPAHATVADLTMTSPKPQSAASRLRCWTASAS